MKKTNKRIKLAAVLFFFFMPFGFISAADTGLYLVPETGIFAIGNTFSVDIIVDTNGSYINAAEGELAFNTNDLVVEKISAENSIFNSWIVLSDPKTANETGVIEFSGILPGVFDGSDGLVVEVVFKGVRNVTSDVNIISGAILAADGKASNIISVMSSAAYTLTSKIVVPAAEYIVPDGAPTAPVVTSSTHPAKDKWYKERTAKLSWNIPKGTTAVKLLVDRSFDTIPTLLYEYPLSERVVDDLSDGVWYFHVQLKNQYGWGGVTHFPIKIDNEIPEYFNITEKDRQNLLDPNVSFQFDAYDELSSISDEYEITIDDGSPVVWRDNGSHVYQVPVLEPGKHSIVVKASDNAGNYLTEKRDFSIDALETPVITEYPESIFAGNTLIVRGTTLPNAEVSIWLKKGENEPKLYKVTSGNDSSFSFITDDTNEEGSYEIQTRVENRKGAKSALSPAVSVVVESSSIAQLASVGIKYLSFTISVIIAIILLGFFTGYTWHGIGKLKDKRKLKKS